ncbi:hypothetical protein DdX_11285 [Ditylenchus destructor]|uniref:Uncharacterized protein n=1 Tax=Ditylenchus destructor TaxID=166010 RepID=A0AAD4MWJ9_9BILA|nr:hypothetical protein DdX_11285 [Ditylenchus destructor]
MTPGKQVSRLKTKINFKRLASIELSDSEDPEKPATGKERLKKLEHLAEKLKVQLKICAYWVIFTVAVYLVIWYNSECWALPFQESPCKQPRVLPLIATNQSTLAEAVDEFIVALRAQIAQFRDTIEITNIADRQAASNATKNAVGQLLSQHASDLVGFGARKREDARLKDVEKAIAKGYVLFPVICMISGIFMTILGYYVDTCKQPVIESKAMNSLDEQENSQNSRLKQLKTRVSLLYIATFICIAAEVSLIFMYLVGQYFSGISPFFAENACKFDETGGEIQKSCPFTDYHNSSVKLEESLNREFAKMALFTTSPIEVRKAVWLFEIDSIDTHINNHQDLKQYHVDRRTMPREIGHVFPSALNIFLSLISWILFILIPFSFWVDQTGSVWRVFKCFRTDKPKPQQDS